MTDETPKGASEFGAKRADAQRNQEAVLEAATMCFAAWGVETPLREIAARAGVGTATIYRHFPTRSDLVIAVYGGEMEACQVAGQALLDSSPSPFAALREWIYLFVDLLVTKRGLAASLQSMDEPYRPLRAYVEERLTPVCAGLLSAAVNAHEIGAGQDPSELMRGVGSLCVGADGDPDLDPRRLVELLILGLRVRDQTDGLRLF